MKITSKFRMTARLSGTDLALRPLLCSKVPVISRFLKYKLCPPPFVSRVLLSWQLVDPYLYESNRRLFVFKIVWYTRFNCIVSNYTGLINAIDTRINKWDVDKVPYLIDL